MVQGGGDLGLFCDGGETVGSRGRLFLLKGLVVAVIQPGGRLDHIIVLFETETKARGRNGLFLKIFLINSEKPVGLLHKVSIYLQC